MVTVRYHDIPPLLGIVMQNLMCFSMPVKEVFLSSWKKILSAEAQASQKLRIRVTPFRIPVISPQYSRPVLSKRTLSFKPRRSSGIPERKTRILMDPTISLRNTFPFALTWKKTWEGKIALMWHVMTSNDTPIPSLSFLGCPRPE